MRSSGRRRKFLRDSLVYRTWSWVSGSSELDQQCTQLRRQIFEGLYPELAEWIRRESGDAPRFLEEFRKGDLAAISRAVDSIVAYAEVGAHIDDLFLDASGRNPVHFLAGLADPSTATIKSYMVQLKRIDPNADHLVLAKDSNGQSPLQVAAYTLNEGLFEYLLNYSDLSTLDLHESGAQLVSELLAQAEKSNFELHCQKRAATDTPFELKQRLRRMLLSVAEAHPSLFEGHLDALEVQEQDLPADLRYICAHAKDIAADAVAPQKELQVAREDCMQFEERCCGSSVETAEERLERLELLRDRLVLLDELLGRRKIPSNSQRTANRR